MVLFLQPEVLSIDRLTKNHHIPSVLIKVEEAGVFFRLDGIANRLELQAWRMGCRQLRFNAAAHLDHYVFNSCLSSKYFDYRPK